ncbi:MAG: hypothetical protein DRQ88_08985 [Epsilonproteobacteria bacterium]|nr:MAG: hypothetical protein DRQ89_06570 [Campylobacterota bacterium]RLA65666.1 MAG: hypothetical protein DRQ88_08985 [Campylobacterota bacterium]
MNELVTTWEKYQVKVKIIEENKLEIALLVKPGSKKEKIFVGSSGEIIVAISKRPVQGQANQAVVKYLGKNLGLAASYLNITSGAKSKIKILQIVYHFSENKSEDYYISKLDSLFGV